MAFLTLRKIAPGNVQSTHVSSSPGQLVPAAVPGAKPGLKLTSTGLGDLPRIRDNNVCVLLAAFLL